MISQFFYYSNSSKNITCPSGKLKTGFTSLVAKPTSPGLLETTFFARCLLHDWLHKQTSWSKFSIPIGYTSRKIGISCLCFHKKEVGQDPLIIIINKWICLIQYFNLIQGNKLWGGRFSGKVDPEMDKFNASIGFDKRMWKEDITVSVVDIVKSFILSLEWSMITKILSIANCLKLWLVPNSQYLLFYIWYFNFNFKTV